MVVLGILIGMFAIAMVVYSGFRMIISQGNQEAVTKAKSSLRWSLAGLILVLFAFVIVSAVGQFLQTRDVPQGPGEVVSPIQSGDIISLFTNIFTGFLSLVGVLAMFFIAINGFRYLTARGDEEQVTQARQGLQWAVLGLIVAALAFVIVAATANFFKP